MQDKEFQFFDYREMAFPIDQPSLARKTNASYPVGRRAS